MTRLTSLHGTFADGTIPVIPGLRLKADNGIADGYSSMSQYNGTDAVLRRGRGRPLAGRHACRHARPPIAARA